MIVSLNHLKKHLYIEHNEDDLYLLSLLDVAEKAVRLNLNVPELDPEDPTVVQSILLLAANLYANREPVAFTNSYKVPITYDYLVSLSKNYCDEKGITT